MEREAVIKIFELALAIFREEPNVLMIEAPCCVFGDLHGQFYDLMNLLDLSGTPPNTQCLFLGDYVDRGMFGLETVLYLLSFKINFPKMFWMLRGNHESRQITQNFNFHRECVVKYGEDVYDLCMQVIFFLFYFILFYFILFYFILFYFILFYFILFYFILFYFILFYFILFYFILFYFILFYFILFYFILFYFILFYFILFYFILFYFILFYFILFYFIFYFILFYFIIKSN